MYLYLERDFKHIDGQPLHSIVNRGGEVTPHRVRPDEAAYTVEQLLSFSQLVGPFQHNTAMVLIVLVGQKKVRVFEQCQEKLVGSADLNLIRARVFVQLNDSHDTRTCRNAV